MNEPRPAISPLALPSLLADLALEEARCRHSVYARHCGSIRVDLQRQIEAARSGAPTWTDSTGAVWGPGRILVGGTVPPPGGNSFGEPLGD